MNSNKYKFKLFLNETGLFLAKNFFIFILFLFFLILVLGFLFFLKPKIDSINEKNSSLDIKETEEYPNKLQEFRKVSNYIEIYNEINPKDREKIDSMLRNHDFKEEIFAKIEYIFAKNGFIVNSITIEEEAVKTTEDNKKEVQVTEVSVGNNENKRILPDGVGKYNIKIDVMGVDYRGLKNILSVLENDVSIIDVEEIAFSPDKETIVLSLSTYYK